MCRSDVDDAAPVALLHRGQRDARGVERRREVQREHRIPAVDRETLDRSDVLDPGVVHQDVDAAVAQIDVREHRLDLVGFREVGAFVVDIDARFGGELRAQPFDLGRVSETVEHDARALCGERPGDAQSDAAGGAGDECELAFEHDVSLYNRPRSLAS